VRNTDLIEKQTIYKLSYMWLLHHQSEKWQIGHQSEIEYPISLLLSEPQSLIVVPDLLLAHGVVVEGAVVLVTVSMNGAE